MKDDDLPLFSRAANVWNTFSPLPRGTLVGLKPSWGTMVPVQLWDDFFIVILWSVGISKRGVQVLHPPTGCVYEVYPDEITLDGRRYEPSEAR